MWWQRQGIAIPYVPWLGRGYCIDYEDVKVQQATLLFPIHPPISSADGHTFGIYHLIEVDDLCETSSINYVKVGE